MIKIFVILILLPKLVFATSIGIGTNMFFARINDPKLKFANELELLKDPINSIRSVNLSISNNYGRVVYSVASNRLLNADLGRVVLDNHGNEYKYRSQATLDSLSLGYALTRKIVAGGFVGNLKLEQKLNDRKSIENAVIYGGAVSYAFNSGSISLILLAPCQAIKSEWGAGISINKTLLKF